MLNDHSKASIAQIIFYIPTVILALHLLYRRHGRPRLAWYILSIFCMIRVACGIVVLLYENKPTSTGLLVASIILLNAGVFPLIGATIGLIRIITYRDYNENSSIRQGLRLARLLFLTGIVVVIVGGSLEGSSTTSTALTGTKLAKAGYIILVVFIAVLLVFQVYFWVHLSQLSEPSRKVLRSISLAMPFIVIRLTYLFLSVFTTDEKWNELFGETAPYVIMALMMEYIVVVIYLATGFIIPSSRGVKEGINEQVGLV
ncbi:hypothetical protein ASPZODRAFT_1104533 [Penicilliopsis zonata CBS 506.65]|uniref:DUF7702 domain-containing protein n=1 Tax=Penicilliopsis zonata CBS 506.65 TaxID=1073090 RepID=A0A1L9SSC4_9EURO|nr:hypothetical protein ASPZODRAFT_1104533 [Penicilliopsis zonata CBS 506.65]OJJ50108.1 hypothetical protein ASPZODRAFT_1104533 [Penicilliopsis zonata CBS 506.65]